MASLSAEFLVAGAECLVTSINEKSRSNLKLKTNSTPKTYLLLLHVPLDEPP